MLPVPQTLAKVFFSLVLFIFLLTIFYIVLGTYNPIKGNENVRFLISISSSFLILYFVLFSPFGKYFTEVILPFILLGFFFLALVSALFPTVGVKFGEEGEENSFISINSTIIMWAGIGILLISFLASLKKMGYSVVNKLTTPTVFGVILFFLMAYFVMLSCESEGEHK
jgi:hypothetical protein